MDDILTKSCESPRIAARAFSLDDETIKAVRPPPRTAAFHAVAGVPGPDRLCVTLDDILTKSCGSPRIAARACSLDDELIKAARPPPRTAACSFPCSGGCAGS